MPWSASYLYTSLLFYDLASDYKNIEDQELLTRFRADGDNKWLGVLLERYTLLLFGVCMKYLKREEEAKDAVQHVFLKALSEFQKNAINNIGGWLYQVARNECLTRLRNQKEYFGEEQFLELVQVEGTPVNLLWKKEKDIEKMKQALQELKDEQRICVSAFYLEKMSYQQIAGQTGFSIKQVKSHIQNGKRNLRLRLEER